MVEALAEGVGRTYYAASTAAAKSRSVMSCAVMCEARPLILMLEDDARAAEALQLVLRDWGADVVHGHDPAEVVAAAGSRASHANMIITDFHLGAEENGVSLAQQLREKAPEARVLVLSGSLSGEAKNAAANAGYAFMRKPAAPRDIIAWLEQD